MYVLDFVNRVRHAQSCESLEELPAAGADGSSPLELAMGCRLETELMRLSSPQAAAAVADATGLPVGVDRTCVALPNALAPFAKSLHESRLSAGIGLSSAS
ncbi:MAG: hypothetical protein KDB58_01340 [Solirubrobacterales bacterium]|nr:hypothetical protein [Solirubrobacterales bacterium]MCB8971906.1 hypothetical protein [Thermoleophilales bacterium]MCO5326290.1 hypothetical protein [Solirubrobacterales bacterium]